MKLYYNPLSTYSQKALIALHEKNVSFTPEIVSLRDTAARATLEKIYPLGKVPLLMLDDGHMIPESTIIIEYLEGHNSGGTRLIPDGTDAARQVRFHDRMSDLYFNEPARMIMLSQMKFLEALPSQIDTARRQLSISCGHLDNMLGSSTWLCGDAFTMADCATIPPLFYLNLIAPFSDYPNLTRYWEQAQQRESYRKVQAEFLPIWQAMQAQR